MSSSLLTKVIAVCLLTILPVAGMIVHPNVYEDELQGRYAYIFSTGILLMILWFLRSKRPWVNLLLIVMISMYSIKSYIHLRYWQRASYKMVEWLDENPPNRPLKSLPPAYIGNAWFLPGTNSWDIARDYYWNMDKKQLPAFSHRIEQKEVISTTDKLNSELDRYSYRLKNNPDDIKSLNNRGAIYTELKKYSLAITDLTRAIEIDNNYSMAFYNRGNAFYRIGEYNLAINDYNEAIRIDPNYIKVFFNRGSTYFKIGKKQQAIDDYKNVIELDPDNSNAYYDLGIIYESMKDAGEALSYYREALNLGDQRAKEKLNDAENIYSNSSIQ